jgi:hypothetical protein
VGRPPKPLMDRLWAKIEYDRPTTCWIYTGALDKDGYGTIGSGRQYGDGQYKNLRVHRLMFEIYRGPIPANLVPDHLCRRPNCVCPWHLELVTTRENLMRGETVYARNAAKPHCPKCGDAYIVRLDPDGGAHRRCTRCLNANRRQNRVRKPPHVFLSNCPRCQAAYTIYKRPDGKDRRVCLPCSKRTAQASVTFGG